MTPSLNPPYFKFSRVIAGVFAVAVLAAAAFWYIGARIAAAAPTQTYTNATFGFTLNIPAGFAAYPPDAPATAMTTGEALVFKNFAGDAIQLTILPYVHDASPLTISDIEAYEPDANPMNAIYLPITTGLTAVAFSDPGPSGYGTNASQAWLAYRGYLFQFITDAAHDGLLKSIVATWRPSN